MKTFRFVSMVTLIFALGLGVTSCKKVNDADLQKAAQTALATNPDVANVVVTVSNQIATLNGIVKDDATKMYAETTVAAVKDMKSVVNNLEIVPPGPDYAAIDAALTTALTDALKDHPTVTFEVKNGAVKLNGEIRKRDLPTVMQKVSALNPESLENNITVK